MKQQPKGQYRQIFVSNERLPQYNRLHAWAAEQPARRKSTRNLSIADAMLDLTIGYLDVIQGRLNTPLAQQLVGSMTIAISTPAKRKRVPDNES